MVNPIDIIDPKLGEDGWTQRQEEVNALMANAVGLDNLHYLTQLPAVRKEVRARLDAHTEQLELLKQQYDQQVMNTKQAFSKGLQSYLTPIAEQAKAAKATSGEEKKSFAAKVPAPGENHVNDALNRKDFGPAG